MKNAKTNTILKRHINKLFTVENTYDTNQTGRWLAFVLNFLKIAHAHISGRQNKNKMKEKHAKSSEHPVNRVPTSFVSVDFEKNMPDSCTAFGFTN